MHERRWTVDLSLQGSPTRIICLHLTLCIAALPPLVRFHFAPNGNFNICSSASCLSINAFTFSALLSKTKNPPPPSPLPLSYAAVCIGWLTSSISRTCGPASWAAASVSFLLCLASSDLSCFFSWVSLLPFLYVSDFKPLWQWKHHIFSGLTVNAELLPSLSQN